MYFFKEDPVIVLLLMIKEPKYDLIDSFCGKFTFTIKYAINFIRF